MDYRAWIIDTSVYRSALATLKSICAEKHIHIEEIPDFCLNLILFPTAWTGVEQEKGGCFNYTTDQFVKAKISDLPECIADKLHLHQ